MKKINVRCLNNQTTKEYEHGVTLREIADDSRIVLNSPIIAAMVNNQLKELSYEVDAPKDVLFIDIAHPDGMRCYLRSLTFLLQKAVKDVFPHHHLSVEHSVSKGLYCELQGSPAVTLNGVGEIAARMRQLVQQDLPFVKTKIPTTEAIQLFQKHGYEQKALLQTTRGNLYTSVYYLDNYPDHFYGPLAPSTGSLQHFGLIPYFQGVLLMLPHPRNFEQLEEVVVQKKMFEIFQEHKDWCKIMGSRSIGQVNEQIQQGEGGELIKVAEALHERKYSQIAEMIAERKDAKIILIAGPSSSGKTTTSKRLAVQLRVSGFAPKVLEMDNYFVNREQTPRDSDGNFDFESLEALDLELFNQHLHDLLAGKEVEIPHFNFTSGIREQGQQRMQLREQDLLIIEGIHGLNPMLTAAVGEARKFKIYVSALTSVSIDNNNRISTTDNRLIRRIVRDARNRGTKVEDTLLRWESVRRGEDRNIFPYQENADIMFDSSLLYELNLLRSYAEPLLHQIPMSHAAFSEANRLLKFLSYFKMFSPQSVVFHIPPTSVIREFIGHSSFVY